MSAGKLVGAAILLCGLGFGAVVYFTQVFAYYEEVAADTVSIRLTPQAPDAAPQEIAFADLRAIDGTSSPLRFRACFSPAEAVAGLRESYLVKTDAVPLNAPGWFDCFDAAEIGAALKDGSAIAFLGEAEIADGVDRVIAVFEDGRAFAWHQLNEKYAD